MPLPNPTMDFTAFDVLTAAELDDLVENDQALAAGTGLDNNAITANKLSGSAIKLGYAQITSNFTTSSATPVQVTGLTSTVTAPGTRSIKITAYSPLVQVGGSPKVLVMSIWDGTVGSGTQLNYSYLLVNVTNQGAFMICSAIVTPSAGSKTYNVGVATDAGGTPLLTLGASATGPAFILVEAI